MSDTEPIPTSRCRECGTEFSGQRSPLGLCPVCLIKLGMSDPDWAPSSDRSAEPAGLLRRSLNAWPIAAAVVLLALIVFFFRRGDAPGSPPAVVRFTLPMPDETELPDGAHFAVSPDGQQIVVAVRNSRGRQGLWIRSLASTDWRELGRTDGAAFPFWSPDSRQVGFFAENQLKRIDVGTGFTYTLCDAPVPRGGAWGPDAFIVFVAGSGNLMRVAASGGTPQALTAGDEARRGQEPAWPHVLPGEGNVIYSASGGEASPDTESAIYVKSLKGGESRALVPGGAFPAFARGLLLFLRGAGLVAQPLDPSRRELTGDVQMIRGTEQIAGS